MSLFWVWEISILLHAGGLAVARSRGNLRWWVVLMLAAIPFAGTYGGCIAWLDQNVVLTRQSWVIYLGPAFLVATQGMLLFLVFARALSYRKESVDKYVLMAVGTVLMMNLAAAIEVLGLFVIAALTEG